eukprot:gene6543-6295_t
MADVEVKFPLAEAPEEGKMKDFEYDGGAILVYKHGGKLFATSAKCTHYGANLKNGVFADGRVRCPWHGQCYSVETGDIEDPVALDCLHTYSVFVHDTEVRVNVPANKVGAIRRNKLSALPASPPLDELAKQPEHHLPYDRTKLSKSLGSTG